MTIAPERAKTKTFDSLEPATGEVFATFPVDGPEEVQAAVDRARGAAQWWRGLGFEGRKKRLDAWRALLVSRIPDIADAMHRENGKPDADARLELTLVVD